MSILHFFSISLQPFPVAENKTGPITIDYLTKRLLALGASQTGGFLVDCETFHSMPPLGKLSSYYSRGMVPVSRFSEHFEDFEHNLLYSEFEVRCVVCFCLFSVYTQIDSNCQIVSTLCEYIWNVRLSVFVRIAQDYFITFRIASQVYVTFICSTCSLRRATQFKSMFHPQCWD